MQIAIFFFCKLHNSVQAANLHSTSFLSLLEWEKMTMSENPSSAIRAFTLARLNVFPSKLLEGGFRGLPASDCLCPCNNDKVESVGHVLLFCSCYQDLRLELLSPIICKSPGRSEEDFFLKKIVHDTSCV